MYKVVIIEDEVRVCDLIVNLINWNSLSLELAGVAYDGISGSEMVDHLEPDVVITDIRLPGMTGIDLIRRYYEQGADNGPKFIIISGYKEFEYAQSALKYGAEDFLLKPINRDELNQTLSKTLSRIIETDQRQQDAFEADERLEYYRNLHRMLMLKNIIEMPEGLRTLTPEAFRARYNIEFRHPYVCSFVLRLYTNGATNQLLFFQEKIAESVLCNIFVDYAVAKFQNGLICHVNLEKYQFAEFRSNILLMKQQIDKLIYPYDFMSFLIAVGNECLISENGFVKATQMAEYTAKAALGTKDNLVFYRDIPHRVTLLPLLRQPEQEDLLAETVEHLNKSALERYLSTFRTGAARVPNYICGLADAAEKLLNGVMSAFQKRYGSIFQAQKIWERANQSLLGCRSEEELFHVLDKALFTALDDITRCVQQLENPIITSVKQYINENYAQKITLERAAEAVYLNPAYLAALFKKETGTTFLDYLTTVRIDRSKLLLQDMKQNLSQITQAVGYSDSKYFSRLFQKYTGIKPQEYRKLYINNLL